MKLTGHADLVGEVLYQAGGTATAIVHNGHMIWEVRREHDGIVRHTHRLAHTSHWSAQPRQRNLRAPIGERLSAPIGNTLLYPDCSNNQWVSVQDAVDFVDQLAIQGFSGMCHKVSEGNYYEDPFFAPVLAACRAAGIPCLGYHYVTGDNPASQAQTYLAAGGAPNAMFDWEANGGDLANYYAVAAAFNAAGVNVGVGYCPKWYWSEVGGGDLSQAGAVVSSGYPGGSGYASTIYANAGGDNGEGWAPYGGVTPTCWQFTDQALIAGITVDCNAFKGTQEQLAQLFTGGPVTQPQPSDPTLAVVQDNQTQLRGPGLNGWPQLAGHTVVDALAVIGHKLGIPGFNPPTA